VVPQIAVGIAIPSVGLSCSGGVPRVAVGLVMSALG